MELYAIRNRRTGRLLVLENACEVGYEPYSEVPRVERRFDLRDSEYRGEVYATTSRDDAERVVATGKVSLAMNGDLAVYNGWRHLDRENDGMGEFALADLEVVALAVA